ncbi:uncharacterized protein I303_108063 [Kwoniella dejecticola CBS 10117]|uniref:Uncharacterized protein n=1 Tax=Kwoniella dejecticola CBS 10117 TaxID=1296121 RepID=A0AAJ8KX15_9TREE
MPNDTFLSVRRALSSSSTRRRRSLPSISPSTIRSSIIQSSSAFWSNVKKRFTKSSGDLSLSFSGYTEDQTQIRSNDDLRTGTDDHSGTLRYLDEEAERSMIFEGVSPSSGTENTYSALMGKENVHELDRAIRSRLSSGAANRPDTIARNDECVLSSGHGSN